MAKKKAAGKKPLSPNSSKSQAEKSEYTEYNVSPEDFVLAWEASSTPDEVAERLNMPKAIVHARASKYRKSGVNLKDLGVSRGRRGIDVDALNDLIQGVKSKKPPARKTGDGFDPDFIQAIVRKTIEELSKKK